MIKNHSVNLFKLIPITLIAIIVTTVFLLIPTGCQTTILEQEQETVEMLQSVFPEACYYHYDEDIEVYNVYDTDKNQIGYAFYAEGLGENIKAAEGVEKVGGPIVILVGLENKETIKGIFVISHKETYSYWDFLIRENYFDQFKGLKIGDAYLTSDGGQVDSITNATSSSTSVINIVRIAALEKADCLN